MNNRIAKISSWISLVIGAGETLPSSLDTIKSNFRQFGHGRKSVSALKEFYKTINDSIDDRIDSMSINEIISAGEVTLGKNLSEFSKNKKIISDKDWVSLDKVVELGFISKDDLNAFINLACCTIKQEAIEAKKFIDTGETFYRKKIAEAHIQSTEVIFSTVTHFFRKKHEISLNSESLDINKLRDIYPKTCLIGRLIQLQDDLKDIKEDLKSESILKKPNSNYFICEKMHSCKSLEESVKSVHKSEYEVSAKKLSYAMQISLNNMWNECIKISSLDIEKRRELNIR
jgi:hypothetical protein